MVEDALRRPSLTVWRVSSDCLLLQAQRGRKTPQKHLWEMPGHAGRRLPDLEELIGSEARARTQVLSLFTPTLQTSKGATDPMEATKP